MALLLGVLFVSGCVFAVRHAARHLRDDYRQSKGKALKQPGLTLVGGSRKRAAVRQHRAGWWAREIRHGFPVTRTGLHTGWMAHQTALAQTLAQREEARTSHLDAQASIADGLREHRKQQEEALERIRRTQEPPPGPDPLSPPNGKYTHTMGPATPLPDMRPIGRLGPPRDGGPPSESGGTHMPTGTDGSDANYSTTLQTYREVEQDADERVNDARRQRAVNLMDQLAALLSGDKDSLADAQETAEALLQEQKAAAQTRDQAAAAAQGLQRRHGGIKEAVDDSPAPMAEKPFYEEG